MLRKFDRDQRITIAIFAAIAVVVLVLALSIKKSAGFNTILLGLFYGCQYSLIAMGLSIIYSSTRVINFAQGELSVLGGALFLTFVQRATVPMLLAFILAVLVVASIGALFERVAIHPLKDSSIITMIIMTIGFSILLRGIIKWVWGANALPVEPFTHGPPLHFLGATVERQSVWVFGFTFLVVIAVYFFFNRTLLGKGMRAAAENPDAANLVGVSPSRSSLMAWMMAAALGAAAGAMFAPKTLVGWDQGVWLGVKGFSAAVLGGLGNVMGAVVGGLTLGVLEFVVLMFIKPEYQNIIALSVLIVVLLLRPQGIIGKTESLTV